MPARTSAASGISGDDPYIGAATVPTVRPPESITVNLAASRRGIGPILRPASSVSVPNFPHESRALPHTGFRHGPYAVTKSGQRRTKEADMYIGGGLLLLIIIILLIIFLL